MALRWEPTHVTKPDPRVVPLQRPWLQLMCCAPVSGREVGRIFWSERSRQDRGPKESVEGVGVDKEILGPNDVNLQTEELHSNYSVLIVSVE